MRRLVNLVRRVAGLPALPPRDEGREQPIPGVVVEIDRTLSGAAVRLAPAVFVLLAGVLAASGTLWWAIVVAGLIAVVARPDWPVAQGFLVLCGFAMLQEGDLIAPAATGGMDGASVGRLAALVLVLHLLLRSAALAGHTPWDGQVELGVLGRAARSVIGTQAVVQVLLVFVAWMRASVLPGLAGSSGLEGQEWLRLLALGAVVVAGALLIPRSWLRRE